MKRLTLITLLAASMANAGWFRTYGGSGWDEGHCVQEVEDGYIVTGYQTLSSGKVALWLFKTDTLGNTLWTKEYGGATSNDVGNFVQRTYDNGYIIAGQSASDVSYTLLLKTDSNGDTSWRLTYGIGIGYCVQQTQDSGYIVTGARLWSASGFPSRLILIKTNQEGDTTWTREYLKAGWAYSWGFFVQQTENSGYILIGLVGDTLYGQEKTALWMIKTDSLGDTLWTYTQGGEDWNHWERGRCVREITDGYVTLANFGLLRFNPFGDTLWVRNYPGGSCVQETSNKGYVITGTPGSSFLSLSDSKATPDLTWLLKTGTQGDSLWKQFYSDGQSYYVEETRDKGFIVTGREAANSNLFLLKTDSLGLLGITENPIVQSDNGWNVPHSIGSYIVLHYQDLPQGFHAKVFDVAGREVDQIRGDGNEGAMTWGINFPPGVYFIQALDNQNQLKTAKVVLVR